MFGILYWRRAIFIRIEEKRSHQDKRKNTRFPGITPPPAAQKPLPDPSTLPLKSSQNDPLDARTPAHPTTYTNHRGSMREKWQRMNPKIFAALIRKQTSTLENPGRKMGPEAVLKKLSTGLSTGKGELSTGYPQAGLGVKTTLQHTPKTTLLQSFPNPQKNTPYYHPKTDPKKHPFRTSPKTVNTPYRTTIQHHPAPLRLLPAHNDKT